MQFELLRRFLALLPYAQLVVEFNFFPFSQFQGNPDDLFGKNRTSVHLYDVCCAFGLRKSSCKIRIVISFSDLPFKSLYKLGGHRINLILLRHAMDKV